LKIENQNIVCKIWKDWQQSLRFSALTNKQYPIEPLITFRVLFGLMMVISTSRFLLLDWVADHYINTQFQFKYFGFEWVQLLPPFWMYVLHWLMLISSVGILLGAFYRLSTILFFLTFTYTELIDLTSYLNHYYFVSIVAFLLIFVPAGKAFSVDILRKPQQRLSHIPFWIVGIFRLQLAIVYVYAGLAKINHTWLFEALPLKIWLPAADKIPVLGWFFKQSLTPYLFAWGGMLYDTFIVFFLSNRFTRSVAYFCVLFFHIVVGILFQIGVFPLVMIAATPIFFSADWHQKIWKWLNQFLKFKTGFAVSQPQRKILACLLLFFFAFQLLFPLRFLLYKGNIFWTEQGYRFSWRVMLMEKAGTATFYVKDGKTGREGMVINDEFLRSHQEKQMAMQPDMILQYAHFLKNHYEIKGMANPKVRAEIYITLNGSPSQLLVDPNLDLTTLEDGWKDKSWILSNP
jgi:hypothetical protein